MHRLEPKKIINGLKQHVLPAIQGAYPTPLQPGQQHRKTYTSNNNVFNSLRPKEKVRYFVTGTTGGKYY